MGWLEYIRDEVGDNSIKLALFLHLRYNKKLFLHKIGQILLLIYSFK